MSQVRVVELAFGADVANRYYWRAPGGLSDWATMQRRLEHLSKISPGSIAHFTRESLEHTTDPVSIVGLARHPLTGDTTYSWLLENVLGRSDVLFARLERSRLLGAAFAGAANLLLEPGEARIAVEWIAGACRVPDNRFFQFMDSMGYRPTLPSGVSSVAGEYIGTMRAARHRLIIAEHFGDRDAIALLLPGAAETTLIATSETFGLADFVEYSDWPRVGGISVEHVRSRITRFSQDYIDLHEQTAAVAEDVSIELAGIPGLLDSSDRPVLAVEIADFLFFQALKIRAIEELLDDAQFDHIVLALGSHRSSDEYVQLLAGVPGLMSDPRLEVISTSHSAGIRARFWDLLDELRDPAPPSQPTSGRVPESLVLRKLDEEAERLGASLDAFPVSGRPWTLVVTANSPAYNHSTAAFVRALQQDFSVRVLQMGLDTTALVEELRDLGGAGPDVSVDELGLPLGLLGPLSELLQARLKGQERRVPEVPESVHHAAAWVLQHSLQRLTLEVIGPALARLKALRFWLSSASRLNELPDAMVLTPQRSPAVSSVASIARHFQVPTIALEPHAQDANYSRYIKVAADYYGAMSDYFRARATQGFGIDETRTRTIGSPRQVAPLGYEPINAQRVARRRFESETGCAFRPETIYLVFFCQPSYWAHMSKVWDVVLEAARATSSYIFLKTHPEESVTRTDQYLSHASARGLTDQVVLLDCDAETAIALADMALTCYSSAAIEASIRQKPVVCVTDGDVRYPVDLSAILGAPIASSAEELAEIIFAFRADRDTFQRRARSLIEREPQFVEGPARRLCDFVGEVIGRGNAAIRPPANVPDRLFLDGPHPVYPV